MLKESLMLIDAHTHDRSRADAVISVSPADYSPEPQRLYSVGWHPWHLPAFDDEHRRLLDVAARSGQVVAIGETGIDRLRGADLLLQRLWLERHIALADELGKPLILHIVRGAEHVMKALRDSRHLAISSVLHGLRAYSLVAQMLLREGFFLSFGARFNPDAVRCTPLDSLLLETDEYPADIDAVAQAVAQARGVTASDVKKAAAANLARLLQ